MQKAIKYITLVALVNCSSVVFAQGKIIIDPQQKNVHEIIMGKGSEIFPESKIFLYNVFFPYQGKEFLITFSILPLLNNGETYWKELNYIDKENTIDYPKLLAEIVLKNKCNSNLITSNFKFIVHKKNGYFETPININYIQIFQIDTLTTDTSEIFAKLNCNTIFTKMELGSLKNETDIEKFISKSNTYIFPEGMIIPYDESKYINCQIIKRYFKTRPSYLDFGWQSQGVTQFAFNPNIGIVEATFKAYFKQEGSIVSRELNRFGNTTMFEPINIDGIPIKNYFKKMRH